MIEEKELHYGLKAIVGGNSENCFVTAQPALAFSHAILWVLRTIVKVNDVIR